MRKIIHVDMDCFYAAVETKYRPELKGKPLAIGGPPQSRSVLCTANYEARKFGVKAAMPSSMAVRKCPHLILVPPNFDLYRKESQAVRRIFERFTDKIEPLSLDEAYLDVTDSKHFYGSATLIAQEVRRLIFYETGLTASAGIAPNKFLAKVASDWNKPNGQFVVTPDQVDRFVRQLKVEKIFGVGKVTASKMHELGLVTCQDLRAFGLEKLSYHFGSRGHDLYELSQGIDRREVKTSDIRKSLTVEETYPKDLVYLDEILGQLLGLYDDWYQRMIGYQDKCKVQNRPCEISGYVVKLKYFDFKSSTHECSGKELPTLMQFKKLMENLWLKRAAPVRLIGLGVRLNSSVVRSQRERVDRNLSFLEDPQNLRVEDPADFKNIDPMDLKILDPTDLNMEMFGSSA